MAERIDVLFGVETPKEHCVRYDVNSPHGFNAVFTKLLWPVVVVVVCGCVVKVVAAAVPVKSAWTALPQSSETVKTDSSSLFEAAVPIGSYYCDYCNIFCNSETQLDAHCAAAKHKLNISSDREHQWNFRPPPLIVADGQYTLCQR